MTNRAFPWIPRVMALAALAAAGCDKNEELLEACTQLCTQRIACEKETGSGTTSQSGCETACISLEGADFVSRSDECTSETSCAYEACVGE